MYKGHHEITVSSAFSAVACLWDGDTSAGNISVVYPWNSGHEHDMIVPYVVCQRLPGHHCVECIGGSVTVTVSRVTRYVIDVTKPCGIVI